MIGLTKTQRLILEFIKRFSRKNGFPPTRQEIADYFGYKSANASEEHLSALEKKGFIKLIRGTSRGIRVVSFDPNPTVNYWPLVAA